MPPDCYMFLVNITIFIFAWGQYILPNLYELRYVREKEQDPEVSSFVGSKYSNWEEQVLEVCRTSSYRQNIKPPSPNEYQFFFPKDGQVYKVK